MPEFVSLRAENGHIVTASKEFAEANGLEQLDPEQYPALDGSGRPLPERADHNPAFDLETATKAQLEAEIARRNDGRADEAQIAAAGNKAELVAAIAADDANTSSQEEIR